MQVSGLIHAEGNLTALDLGNCLGNIGGHGTGLGVRHQATGTQHAGHTTHLSHLVGGGDCHVEVGPAFSDPGDQIVGADHIGTGGLSLGGLLASGEHDNAHGLTGAVRQRHGTTHQLVGLAGVNTQANSNINGGIEILRRGFLDQLSGLQRGVQPTLVQLLYQCLIGF